jgi:hypothetical protein
MDMPASESLHLGVALDEFTEIFMVFEGLKVHVTNGRGKWWMVHENQCWNI